MRRFVALAQLATQCLAIACASEDGGPLTQPMMSAATAPDPNRSADDVLYTRFRPCAEQTDCALDESCVIGVLDPFNVCLKSCTSVDDCSGPSANFPLEGAQSVTCSGLQGADRCVLSCESDADCPGGMACVQSACVWP